MSDKVTLYVNREEIWPWYGAETTKDYDWRGNKVVEVDVEEYQKYKEASSVVWAFQAKLEELISEA